jgi:fermentation-respiration switch protein FrsA (DUF1100 family)
LPERADVSFQSTGERCAAWHLRGEGSAFETDAGRPCVVMAHGIGGTRDSGLLPFAEAFAAAGLDALVFDYRCFGASSGEPRQLGTPDRHRDDYRAAVSCARGLEGVDPDRVVLWGTSWSGGHVIPVAAEDPRIAAVISQTPDLDGPRTVRHLIRNSGFVQFARLGRAGTRDGVGDLRGQPPQIVPIVARPGELGVLTTEDALPGYEAIAGPSWRNEIAARVLPYELRNRPLARAAELRCPLLLQAAEHDSLVPADVCRDAAWEAKGRSELRSYPCAHFDIYVGEWRERAIADQLHFLRRHLAAGAPAAEAASAAS